MSENTPVTTETAPVAVSEEEKQEFFSYMSIMGFNTVEFNRIWENPFAREDRARLLNACDVWPVTGEPLEGVRRRIIEQIRKLKANPPSLPNRTVGIDPLREPPAPLHPQDPAAFRLIGGQRNEFPAFEIEIIESYTEPVTSTYEGEDIPTVRFLKESLDEVELDECEGLDDLVSQWREQIKSDYPEWARDNISTSDLDCSNSDTGDGENYSTDEFNVKNPRDHLIDEALLGMIRSQSPQFKARILEESGINVDGDEQAADPDDGNADEE